MPVFLGIPGIDLFAVMLPWGVTEIRSVASKVSGFFYLGKTLTHAPENAIRMDAINHSITIQSHIVAMGSRKAQDFALNGCGHVSCYAKKVLSN